MGIGRSKEQLTAWAELLELCDDDCEVFATTKPMRTAVIEVERELARLHRIEAIAIELHEEDDIPRAPEKLRSLVREAIGETA